MGPGGTLRMTQDFSDPARLTLALGGRNDPHSHLPDLHVGTGRLHADAIAAEHRVSLQGYRSGLPTGLRYSGVRPSDRRAGAGGPRAVQGGSAMMIAESRRIRRAAIASLRWAIAQGATAAIIPLPEKQPTRRDTYVALNSVLHYVIGPGRYHMAAPRGDRTARLTWDLEKTSA
jgi:hypothetical protein